MTRALPVPQFIGKVRRRALLGSLLGAAVAATVINEAVRWAAIAVMWWTSGHASVLDVGPIALAMLAAGALRRWTDAAAARLADRRLGLGDRLTSFLDFAVRGDVPDEVRSAQAQETRRALGGLRPAAAAPVNGWLAIGPLLLITSLAYPYFLFTDTETTTTAIFRRFGAGTARRDGTGLVAGGPASGERPEEAGTEAGAQRPEANNRPEAAEESASPRKPEQGQPAASTSADGPQGDAQPAEPQDEAKNKRPPGHEDAEPGQLVSERVGRELAKVVNPVYNPVTESQQSLEAVGRVSINLVPRSRPGSAGGAPGEGSAARRVTVDLDALPEQYRPLVKTYFELLADGTPPAGGTTTPPARRSGTP